MGIFDTRLLEYRRERAFRYSDQGSTRGHAIPKVIRAVLCGVPWKWDCIERKLERVRDSEST